MQPVFRYRKFGFFFVSWHRTAVDCATIFWTGPSEECRWTDCQDTVQSSPELKTDGLDYVEHWFTLMRGELR